jgi:hypothetical protein
MQNMQLQPSPEKMNAFFEPAAAIAACRAEDIMNMSPDHLAQVAWPLLPDTERTLSMHDVFFTPPMRVSASPRATEATFAAGIQSCLTDLHEKLARIHFGESTLSVARLRAAALAYQISVNARGSVTEVQRRPLMHATSQQGSVAAASQVSPSSSAESLLFDFALPTFHASGSAETTVETSAAAPASTAAPADTRGAGGAVSANTSAVPTTAIHSNSHNPPPDGVSSEPHATAFSGSHKSPHSDRTDGGDAAEGGRGAPAGTPHNAAERASYERKTRAFVSDFVDSQWEAVLASALRNKDTVNTSTTTTTASAPKAGATPSAAEVLRHKIVRTALVLCAKAPTSAAAGHSFACLLKHALRAVAVTDTIRCADGSNGDSEGTTADVAANSTMVHESTSVAECAATRSAGASASPAAAEGSATSATPLSVAQLQARLWVEVVMALLHCVPLVQWTDDVLIELGQLLETVAAAATATTLYHDGGNHSGATHRNSQRVKLHCQEDAIIVGLCDHHRWGCAESGADSGLQRTHPFQDRPSKARRDAGENSQRVLPRHQ